MAYMSVHSTHSQWPTFTFTIQITIINSLNWNTLILQNLLNKEMFLDTKNILQLSSTFD